MPDDFDISDAFDDVPFPTEAPGRTLPPEAPPEARPLARVAAAPVREAEEARPAFRRAAPSAGLFGRELPHSLEAEEYLLSCCFIDGEETLARCEAEKLTAADFFAPANQKIFARLLEMRRRGLPIELSVLAEELKAEGKLDEIGGYRYLMQVSSKIPTTAQTGYFVERVQDLAQRREIIQTAGGVVERAFTSTDWADELLEPVIKLKARFEGTGVPADALGVRLADMAFPLDDERALIGVRGRFICRGGAWLIVAPAGMGKSTVSYQMAACFGVGEKFMGLDCKGPLRVLCVQAEDDVGDIGEVAESIRQGMGLTEAQMATFRQNVLIVQDKINTGDAFLVALRGYVRSFKPDLVIINPIMAYCPGLSDEKIAGPFLYGGLNGLNAKGEFAYLIIHHTPKPPVKDEDKKAKDEASNYDRQYTAFGSSVLTNYFRAITNIRHVRGVKGQFIFSFDKRGSRAGLTVPVTQGAGFRHEPTTELRVQHSERKIKVGEREFPMILWEASTMAEPEKDEPTKKGPKPPKVGMLTEEQALKCFPVGFENRLAATVIDKEAMRIYNCRPRAVASLLLNLGGDNRITQSPDGKWYRP